MLGTDGPVVAGPAPGSLCSDGPESCRSIAQEPGKGFHVKHEGVRRVPRRPLHCASRCIRQSERQHSTQRKDARPPPPVTDPEVCGSGLVRVRGRQPLGANSAAVLQLTLAHWTSEGYGQSTSALRRSDPSTSSTERSTRNDYPKVLSLRLCVGTVWCFT